MLAFVSSISYTTIAITLIVAALTYAVQRSTRAYVNNYLAGSLPSLQKLGGLPTRSVYFPLIGDLFDLAEAAHNTYLFFHKVAVNNQYHNFRMWLGWFPAVVLNEPEDVYFAVGGRESQYFHKSFTYQGWSWWLGDSLLLTEGEQWQKQRHIFNPAFAFDSIKATDKVIQQRADILVQQVKTAAETNASIDINNHLCNLTLDVLGLVGFGYDFECQVKDSKYKHYFQTCLLASKYKQYKVMPWQYRKEFAAGNVALAELNKVIRSVVDERKQRGTPADATDLLAQISKQPNKLTETEILGNLHLFFFAGSDTTSSLLTSALWKLSANPEAQRKLQQELDEHIAGADRPFNADDTTELIYLQAVLRETLRLLPPGPLVGRQAQRSLTFPSGLKTNQYSINLVNIYSVHLNPSVWGKDVEEWKPERWITHSNTLSEHPHVSKHKLATVFLPFAAGRRVCIGQTLARLEAAIVLAELVRHFDLALDDKYTPEVVMESTLMYPGGLHVKPTLRKSIQ